MAADKSVRSSLPNLRVAMADPAPKPEVAQYLAPSQNHGEYQASRIYLDSTGAPPAIFRAFKHQHFHAVSPAVGKEISTVWTRCTEHHNYSSNCRFGAGAHVQGQCGELYGFDADHWARSRIKHA